MSLSQIAMFAASRQRSASRSNDDRSSIKDRSRRLFQRHVHDLSISSHSLATTSLYHDDLPTPSAPTHDSHTTSAHSTPITSPSTGYSSLVQGSLSSATSESGPSVELKYQSELGLLAPGVSSPCSPATGSVSSSSSHPVSPHRRPTIGSDPQTSAPQVSRRYHSNHSSHLPSTSIHSSPAAPITSNAENSTVDHHTRCHSSRLTVNIKSFLSKPAVPSPSCISFNSSGTTPSDSETSSRSFHVLASASKYPLTSRKSRPPDLEISSSVAPAMPSPGPTSNAQIDSHRRYASEAVSKIYNTRTCGGTPTSQESLDVPLRNTHLSPVCGKETKTRNVLKRRPSGSVKTFKGRERGMSTPSCPRESNADPIRLIPKDDVSRQAGVPFPLTVAGALVETYKPQELHDDETLSPPRLSTDDQMSSSASYDGRSDRDLWEHSPRPYYTVFGSPSERGMQAGGSGNRQNRFEAGQCAWATSAYQPSMSNSAGRNLVRKVSGRWRRNKGGHVASEESFTHGREPSSRRPSIQEVWAGDQLDTRSTGRSMDSVPNARDGAWASPSASHARSGSEKGESGKLWRLMRRISTGGLRDRFQSNKIIPPVPAIPKELLERTGQGECSNEPLTPSYEPPSAFLPDKDNTWLATSPKNATIALPSVITSSPNSSDVASARSPHRLYSPRSSVSSFGEAVAVPRLPDIILDRRIITPLEQLRLADDHSEIDEPVAAPWSPPRSSSVPVGLRSTEDAEDALVPLASPRRQTCPGETTSSGSSRPSSASASPGSARGSYQDRGFGYARSRMDDGTVPLCPPPRPPRSSRRGGGGSVASSPTRSMMTRQDYGGVRQMDRMPSAQSDMTARYEPPERGRSRGQEQGEDEDIPPHTGTQLTFRELDAPRRPPLSEREKADIWDELLARSDKAGGTLHINGAAELMSDRISMRFSTHSEV